MLLNRPLMLFQDRCSQEHLLDMILQLDPMIPMVMDHGPNAQGYAFVLIDYSQEHNVLWGVACDVTGEIWWVPNKYIRFQFNTSMGRVKK